MLRKMILPVINSDIPYPSGETADYAAIYQLDEIDRNE